ncbi:MAG: tetratricopeptide repeat protein [Methanosarcinaceae archaeon]|nr:tetratricopeptide repeat protein [Methanosarcinaceae archaeon]
MIKDLCYYAEIQPHEFKAEALLKLTPKLLEMGENEDARYEINKLKEHAAKYKVAELEDEISRFELRLFFSENKYEEAIEAIDKALEINPSDDIALKIKDIVLATLGKYEEALEVLNKALEINPVNCYALTSKGKVLAKLGKYEKAIEVFNKVLEINPVNYYALANKGVLLIDLGKIKEALETFNKALEIDPNDNFALASKGFALVILKKYEEALEVLNKALEIDPNYELTLMNKAFALYNLKRYTEGLEIARKMVDIATDEHFKIYGSLIVIETYMALNRKSEAAFEIEKIESKMIDQEPDLVEHFMDICLKLARDELKDDNRGSASKFIKFAFKNSSKLNYGAVNELTMGFLKSTTDTGILSVLKAAVEEIIDQQKEEFEQLIRPIIKAIEIVETKDLKKYYDLQIEEREIVADVVKKITKSDELIPDEIKRKEEIGTI